MATVHIHQDIIVGIVMHRPCLDDSLDVTQPRDALVAAALDRLGRARWVSSDGQGVDLRVLDMLVLAKEVAVIRPRMPEDGVGAAEGNTSGQCWIVSQPWRRTVRSYRNAPHSQLQVDVQIVPLSISRTACWTHVFLRVRAKFGFSAQAAVRAGCDLCSEASLA